MSLLSHQKLVIFIYNKKAKIYRLTGSQCLFYFLSFNLIDHNSLLPTQSQNHGEYVFEAETGEKQASWISAIKTHSINLAPSTNGHLPE